MVPEPEKEHRPVDDIDLDTVESVALRRLIEEVRAEGQGPVRGYNRTYSRHNRS
jgi:hypothetical protein